jgi:hypothetical protein
MAAQKDPDFLDSLVEAVSAALPDGNEAGDVLSGHDCRTIAQAVVVDIVRQGYVITPMGGAL